MALSFVNATTATRNAGNTTHPINKPAGLVAGDLLLVCTSWDGGSSGLTPPAGQGFTEVIANPTGERQQLWKKTIDGTEGLSFTFTSIAGRVSAIVAAGFHHALIDQVPTPLTSAGSTTIQAPSLTPTALGILVCFFGIEQPTSGTYVFSQATGMTERAEAAASGSPGVALDTQDLVSLSATGTKSVVASGPSGAAQPNTGYSVNLISSVNAVDSAMEFRWDEKAFVTPVLEAQWDQKEFVTPVLEAQWEQRMFLSDSVDLRWNILELVPEVTTEFRWSVIGSLTTDPLELQWNSGGFLDSLAEFQWDQKEILNITPLSLQWGVFITALADPLVIQWDQRSFLSMDSLDLQWSMQQTLSNVIDFYWNIYEFVIPSVSTIHRDVPIPPEFLAALLGPATQIHRRVDIYEEDGETEFMIDAPFLSGNVQVDMTRSERRIFDLVLDNRDGAFNFYPEGFWYDKVIKMYRGVEYEGDIWETQIGQFVIDTTRTQDFPHSIAINGRDYTAKLMEAEFEGATSYAATVEFDDLIKALALKGQVDKFRIPLTSIQLGKTYMFEGGTKLWDAIVEVCTAFGYEVFFDAWGYLVVRPFQDPVTAPVAWLFETGPLGNLASFAKSTNQSRVKNHVIVTGKTTADVPIYRAVSNLDPNSPTSIPRLKRTKTYKFNSGFVTTTTQALALAESLLKVQSLESYDLNFSSIVLPWLEAGVIVAFDDPNPAPGDPDKFLLSSFTIPMSLGPMSGNARRVTVVKPTSG